MKIGLATLDEIFSCCESISCRRLVCCLPADGCCQEPFLCVKVKINIFHTQISGANFCGWVSLDGALFFATGGSRESPPRQAAHTRWVSYWQPLPLYSASRPPPRAASPLVIATRRVARPTPLPRGGTHSVSCWQPLPQTDYDPKKYLRPPVARASRPPSAGSDTRRCSCLRAGRLTRCRWALQPGSLYPKREIRSYPARRENLVQKQFMLLNDFPPHPRRAVPSGTRTGEPLPLQAYTLQVSTLPEETALGPGRPRVPAEGKRQPIPRINATGGNQRVISPRIGVFRQRSSSSFGSRAPSRYISLVSAASTVISRPLTTPARSSARPVSYSSMSTLPAAH